MDSPTQLPFCSICAARPDRSARTTPCPLKDTAPWVRIVTAVTETSTRIARLGGSAAWCSDVLSIGKLAVGQAGYYLEQAHGSVSRAGALHSGVEDYYLGGPEAAGVWVGGGGRALGLVGNVDAVRLDRVLAGEHPSSGVPLGRVVDGRVPGVRLDVLGAEERQRVVRDRRRRGARHDPRRARSCGRRGARLRRADGRCDAPRS
jgi:hypothetical protein